MVEFMGDPHTTDRQEGSCATMLGWPQGVLSEDGNRACVVRRSLDSRLSSQLLRGSNSTLTRTWVRSSEAECETLRFL